MTLGEPITALLVSLFLVPVFFLGDAQSESLRTPTVSHADGDALTRL